MPQFQHVCTIIYAIKRSLWQYQIHLISPSCVSDLLPSLGTSDPWRARKQAPPPFGGIRNAQNVLKNAVIETGGNSIAESPCIWEAEDWYFYPKLEVSKEEKSQSMFWPELMRKTGHFGGRCPGSRMINEGTGLLGCLEELKHTDMSSTFSCTPVKTFHQVTHF